MSDKSHRRKFVGTVKSNKMKKTVTVAIERLVKHPFYKKYIKRTTKIMAHDEKGECSPGDIVEIKETRPISKNKNFVVMKITKKAIAKQDLLADTAESEVK
jgi:small subunit ribosomal protein S17